MKRTATNSFLSKVAAVPRSWPYQLLNHDNKDGTGDVCIIDEFAFINFFLRSLKCIFL